MRETVLRRGSEVREALNSQLCRQVPRKGLAALLFGPVATIRPRVCVLRQCIDRKALQAVPAEDLVDLAEPNGPEVYAWFDGTTNIHWWYTEAQRIMAPADCSGMFARLPYIGMDLPSRLDMSQVEDLTGMFQGSGSLRELLFSSWKAGVNGSRSMFHDCANLDMVWLPKGVSYGECRDVEASLGFPGCVGVKR